MAHLDAVCARAREGENDDDDDDDNDNSVGEVVETIVITSKSFGISIIVFVILR